MDSTSAGRMDRHDASTQTPSLIKSKAERTFWTGLCRPVLTSRDKTTRDKRVPEGHSAVLLLLGKGGMHRQQGGYRPAEAHIPFESSSPAERIWEPPRSLVTSIYRICIRQLDLPRNHERAKRTLPGQGPACCSAAASCGSESPDVPIWPRSIG